MMGKYKKKYIIEHTSIIYITDMILHPRSIASECNLSFFVVIAEKHDMFVNKAYQRSQFFLRNEILEIRASCVLPFEENMKVIPVRFITSCYAYC